MRTRNLIAMGVGLALLGPGVAAAAQSTFASDPERGNSAFTAVFDSAVGERITAVSSAVGCTLEIDEKKLSGSARCSVPLTSVRVDNEDTKTEHFQQWATNKKLEASQCTFDLDVPLVTLPSAESKTPASFEAEGTFTICGRARDDGGTERITGTVTYLPAGTYGKLRTLRVRAHIEGFDRERYGVSPKQTAGWLARVQQLADVVASEGTIDVSLFATE